MMDSQALEVYNNTNDTLFCFWDTDKSSTTIGNNPLNWALEIEDKDTTWTKANFLMFPKAQSQFTDYNWHLTIDESETKRLYLHFYSVRKFYNQGVKLIKPITPDTTLEFTLDELQKLNWQVHIGK
ncbi:MAG: hypothetical protein KF900_10480 [Bacteroidetes bacterium]|nr:hypothetical protein [Bacteroidota bacterium]